jgi:hypothetical protein
MDPRTGRGCSSPTQKGHTIETNRDGHKLRQVAVPQVGGPIGDTEFEIRTPFATQGFQLLNYAPESQRTPTRCSPDATRSGGNVVGWR